MALRITRTPLVHLASVLAAVAWASLLTGCRPDLTASPPAAIQPAPTAPTVQTSGLDQAGIAITPTLAYSYDGLSLRYPVDASVVELPEGGAVVVGPRVLAHMVGLAGEPYHQAYELFITTHDNPGALSAEAWARDYILKEWAKIKAAGGPPGGLPVNEQGQIDPQHVGATSLGTRQAFWVDYDQFDATRRAYYVAVGARLYDISYVENVEGNVPIAPLQKRVYANILESLTFAGPPD